MKVPSHTTVVAYLALFVAIGGSAYAVSKIGSPQIKNHSIRGKDVAHDTLRGRQVDEGTLIGPVAVGNAQSGSCDPPTGAPVECIGESISLPRESAVLLVATASKVEASGAGSCGIAVDGSESVGEFLGGTARDGFAITRVTAPIDRGSHPIALRCSEASGDFRVDNPTIAAVAVNSP